MHRRLSARQQVLCSVCRFYRKTILRETAGRLHALHRKIAVTSLEEAQDHRDADLGENVALVIGNEGTCVYGRSFLDAC